MPRDKKGKKDAAEKAVKPVAAMKKPVAARPRTSRARPAKATKRSSLSTASAPGRPDREAYGNRAFTKTSSPHAGISITVQIPPLRRPRSTAKIGAEAKDRPEFSRSRLLMRTLALPLLLIVGSLVFYNTQAGPQKKAPAAPVATVRTQPDYEPLLPSAEKSNAARYDAKRNLVTYSMTFSGARITVSQQPLPASFAKDPAAFTKAGDSIKASQRIDTTKGPLLVATNEDSNDQFALYATSKVLVFIHSESKMDDASWKAFIELLEAKSWEELV